MSQAGMHEPIEMRELDWLQWDGVQRVRPMITEDCLGVLDGATLVEEDEFHWVQKVLEGTAAPEIRKGVAKALVVKYIRLWEANTSWDQEFADGGLLGMHDQWDTLLGFYLHSFPCSDALLARHRLLNICARRQAAGEVLETRGEAQWRNARVEQVAKVLSPI